ncbi:MAG: helix-turn-helix domain-containing protein [Alphaproteobacteria bacterium]|jgi:transcriptional regulator with XRE-family HTH domain|nr:helix-turn-helix domain-containing protein [Alphaproteobacteria bacterium]
MDVFGERCEARREQLGLSQAEVARRAGLDPTQLNHYVRGRHDPPLHGIVRICRVLDLTPGQLLGTEPMPLLPDRDHPRAARLEELQHEARLLDDEQLAVAVRLLRALRQ